LDRFDGSPMLINLASKYLLESGNIEEFQSLIHKDFSKRADSINLEFENGFFKPKLVKSINEFGIVYPNSEILITSPYIYTPQLDFYWKKQLTDFEKLINSSDTTEQNIQNFFEQNPQFLTGINYKSVIAQPILEHLNGNMKPDFLLCPHHGFYGDILELKLPKEKIISGRNNRIKFSSKVEDAIAQVRHYREFFQESSNREKFLKKYGITAYKPKVSIFIGKTPSLVTYEKILDLKEFKERDRIDIITYDEVFDKMKILADKM